MKLLVTIQCLVLVALLSCSVALADTAEAPKGLLPLPDYSSDIWHRDHLLGDLGGVRTDLANNGLLFDIDMTQGVQRVARGGINRETEYGNSVDYNITADLMRMGVLPGALVTFRAESRFGNSVNGDSGSILPVNTDSFFPLTSKLDDEVGFTITTLSYTQFLSERFAVTLGKFDTLDGDPNEFASGRGLTQFMDANFLFNSALALRLPYSTLGGGLIWMPAPPSATGGITVKTLLVNTTDSSESSGFDTFDDGLSSVTEADFQYRLFQLAGGQNLGFLYSFDQNFRELGSRFIFQPGEGIITPTENSTWAAYWSAWQYLVTWDSKEGPIDLMNRKPDHQGVGLFARAGLADEDTNPIEYSFSGGIGGRGVFDRTDDMYGIGYYYTAQRTSRFVEAIGVDDKAQGFELFYNLALTPGLQLTLDLQWIDSALPRTDTAFLLGGRLRTVF